MFFKFEKNNRFVNPSNEIIYFDKYLINNGDTLFKIANKVNSNPNLIASINGINLNDYIYPGDIILIPKKDFNYYITKEGDTLEIVKDAFNTNMNDLINNNTTIYLLPGQIMVQKK